MPGGISAAVSHVRMFSKLVDENAARFRHDGLSAVTMPEGAEKIVFKKHFLTSQNENGCCGILLKVDSKEGTRAEQISVFTSHSGRQLTHPKEM